jgi:cytochrome c oxidase subunit 4
MSSNHAGEMKTYYIVFMVLIALVFLTVFAAAIEHDFLNLMLALAIAFTKASLIVWFFMHVNHAPPLIRLVIAASLLFVIFLFAFTFSDYLTRQWSTATGINVQAVVDRSAEGE